jgi:hypothetical protein
LLIFLTIVSIFFAKSVALIVDGDRDVFSIPPSGLRVGEINLMRMELAASRGKFTNPRLKKEGRVKNGPALFYCRLLDST